MADICKMLDIHRQIDIQLLLTLDRKSYLDLDDFEGHNEFIKLKKIIFLNGILHFVDIWTLK